MPRLVPLPSEFADRPFSVSEARDRGIAHTRLSSDDLARPFHGVRRPVVVTRSTDDFDGGVNPLLLETCRAYAALGRLDAFSHSTAAELFGVPLPARLRYRDGEPVHVTVAGAARGRQGAGVIGHTRNRLDTVDRHGVTAIAPPLTWLDLAPRLNREELVTMADAMVSGIHPLCTIDELTRIASTPRARGVRKAREALELVRVGVESPQETALRLAIVDAALPEPSIQFAIHDSQDEFVARVDLAYPVHRIAIEYEGDLHRSDRSIWRKDITRHDRLEDLGWRMIRVTIDDLVPSPVALIGRIRRARAATFTL
ncbi:hypothetical protein [Leifsonia poae]|uniref:DUF559 domain-containing protein n=1 Tax=Leifsonia poae TaxID=110933 RepID=A0A9W6LYJ5_9MICO|nr:hypothetical protein [Leifsonia poae]GLJ74672.1 hypothetical protein GCM10017584_02450 [Leifsonia poae]